MHARSTPRVISTSPTWRMNGVNVFTLNLTSTLRHRGWQASVLITNPGRFEKVPMERPPDLPLDELPVGPGARPRQRWRALADALEGASPCVYLPNYDVQTSCVCPRLSAGVAVVGVVHADDPQHYEHLGRLGHTWNAVVAVSETVAERCRALVPELGGRITTIPIGVPVPARPPDRDRAPGAALEIAYCGLLKQHQKRILDLPEVLAELERRGVAFHMTFAGDGSEREELERRCADMVHRGLVRFVGVLDRRGVSDLLARQDAVVLCSEFEGLPNALLEAMAAGCVPVVTEVPSGVCEVVRDLENGLTAPIGNVAALAGGLERLARDPSLWARLSSAAHRTVAEGPYNLDHMVTAYEALFLRVAQDAARGRFRRAPGPVLPPPDLQPLWRHYVPEPLKKVWRSVRGSRSNG